MSTPTHKLLESPAVTRPLGEEYVDRFIRNRYAGLTTEVRARSLSGERHVHADGMRLLPEQTGLNRLVHHTADLVRIEPDNPYLLHSLVPSARGRNANRLLLVRTDSSSGGSSRRRAYEYCPASRQWHPVGEDILEGAESTELWILYDRSAIGSLYGDFSFTLAVLDAGHVVEQVRQLLTARGIRTRITENPAPGGLLNRYDPRGFSPLVSIDVSPVLAPGPILAPVGDPCLVKHRDRLTPFTGKESTRLVDRILAELTSCTPTERCSWAAGDQLCEPAAMARRTSGQSRQGCSFLPTPLGRQRTDNLVRRTAAALDDLGGGLIGMVFLIPSDKGCWVYSLVSDENPRLSFAEMSAGRLIHDTTDYLQVASASCLFLTTIGPDARTWSAEQILSSLLRSAELIHRVSLFLTEDGMVTRPVKNIADDVVEHDLCPGETATYMLLAGTPVGTNTFMEI